MKKKIDLQTINKIFEKRSVAITVAAVSVLGILLTLIFLIIDVSDSVNMRSSINVNSKNTVTYDVKLTEEGEDIFGTDTLDMNGNYLRKFTKSIMVRNDYDAYLSKEVDFTYAYSVTKTFIIRASGNGNPIVFSRPETDPTSGQTFESNYVGGQKACPIDPAPYYAEFKAFSDELLGTGVRLVAELAVEFKLSIHDGNNINFVTQRGIVIPLTSETYRITFNGQEEKSENFPERNIKLPGLPVLFFVTVLIIALISLLLASLKRINIEKDEYKNTLKNIFKKSVDGIIKTAADATIPDYPSIDVADFKELAKTSLSLGRPIVCFETAKSTIFYVVCDNLLYRFALINKLDDNATPHN